MSVLARRLSAVPAPQEAILTRRASLSGQDLTIQGGHPDSRVFQFPIEAKVTLVHDPSSVHLEDVHRTSQSRLQQRVACSPLAGTLLFPPGVPPQADGSSPSPSSLPPLRRLSSGSCKTRHSPGHLQSRRLSFETTLLSPEVFLEKESPNYWRRHVWEERKGSPVTQLPQTKGLQHTAETRESPHGASCRPLQFPHSSELVYYPQVTRVSGQGPCSPALSPGLGLLSPLGLACSPLGLACSCITPTGFHSPVHYEARGSEGEGGRGKGRTDPGISPDAYCRVRSCRVSQKTVPNITIDLVGPSQGDGHLALQRPRGYSEERGPGAPFPWGLHVGTNQVCPASVQLRRASWHSPPTASGKESSPSKVMVSCCSRPFPTAIHPKVCKFHHFGKGCLKQCPNQDSIPAFTTHSLGGVLGKGGFGVVKLGCYKGCGVAVKVLRGRRAAATLDREANTLSLMPHVHLAWTLAVVRHGAHEDIRVSWASALNTKEQVVNQQTLAAMFSLPMEDSSIPQSGEEPLVPAPVAAGQRPRWGWVVSELCTSQTLLTLINDSSLAFTTETSIRYTLDLSRGLSYLHSCGLAHLDIKPANALLTAEGHLKIADFGCCAKLGQPIDKVLGTVTYQAPEVLRGGAGGSHSDVFSLGVTIWHLLTRTLPYLGLHPHTIIYQVVQLHQRPPDHQPHLGPRTFLDGVLWRLAESCWAQEPTSRPTAEVLCRNLTMLYLASSPRNS